MNRDSNELHTKNWEEDTLLSRTASASSSGDDSRMTERAGNRGAGFKAFIWLVAVGLLGLILVDAIFLVVMLVHVVPSSDATAPLVFCELSHLFFFYASIPDAVPLSLL